MKSRLLIALLAVAAVGTAGCTKLKARDNLNKGVASFKAAKYDKAVEHFQEAKKLDPTLTNARLYLATAYATMYIPGAPSEENVRNGEAAIKEFQEADIIIAPSIKQEGKLYQRTQHIGMNR